MSAEMPVSTSTLFGETDLIRRKLRVQKIMSVIFGLMCAAILLPLIALVVYLVIRAAPALTWNFLADIPRSGMRAGGIWPALVGTGYIVVISLLVSAPIGVMAGIYLNEYASENWFTRIVHMAVVNLAGVPSIVHALFGVGAFVLFAGMGKSIIAASCTVAIMTLPVIIVATKEALASVPKSFRMACWNLGATRWQTIRTIVLPNSVGGILTGVILAVCRAAGETAPIMFTGVVFFKAVEPGALLPYGLSEQCMALSYHLYAISTQVPNMPPEMLYGTAVVLLGFVLVFNSFAIALRAWMRHRKRW